MPNFTTRRVEMIEHDASPSDRPEPRRTFASADDAANGGELARDPSAFWALVARVRAEGADYRSEARDA